MKINPFPLVPKSIEFNGLTIECDSSRVSVYGPVNFEIKNDKSSLPLIQKLMTENYGLFDPELRSLLERVFTHLLNAAASEPSAVTPNTNTTAANPFL